MLTTSIVAAVACVPVLTIVSEALDTVVSGVVDNLNAFPCFISCLPRTVVATITLALTLL